MSTEANLNQRESEAPRRIEPQPRGQVVAPPVDVYENRDEFLLIADMPGVVREDLRIHLDKGQLTIQAGRPELARGKLLAAEARATEYRRAFSVPQGIDVEKISADLKDGVLYVHLPKSADLKPRQIQVRAG
jgi:HSP20 family protein